MNIHYHRIIEWFQYGTQRTFGDPCDGQLLKFCLKVPHPASDLPLATRLSERRLLPGKSFSFSFYFQNGMPLL